MGSTTRNRRRQATRAVLAGGAVLVGLAAVRRGTALAQVAPDLRSPVLAVPLDVRSKRVLRTARSVITCGALPIVPGIEVSERSVGATGDAPAVRVLVYERPGRVRPSGALLWIHGGGMVMGQAEQDQDWCSWIAANLGAVVVSVDYRLAPEHPFPAALDDCAAALAWLHGQASELGVDPDRIAVGGGSAGGGLAASLCQRARDDGGPPVCFQLLNAPMLDDRTVLRTDHGGRGAFVWTPASNRFGWTAYLGRAPRADDAPRLAAPARTDDLAGLPPAWIGVGDLDLFHDEDVDYATRLEAAGVPCRLHTEAGMYHAADSLRRRAPRMERYRDEMLHALNRAIG